MSTVEVVEVAFEGWRLEAPRQAYHAEREETWAVFILVKSSHVRIIITCI
jgi:hypothetical protein